ncbi:MAG: MBL fold metallo-hydrolase, partial [Victivallales bacterium]
IYCTHNHIDHLDPEGLPEILKLNKDCPVSGPVSVVKECGKLGIRPAKLIQAEIDKPFKAGPFELIPVKAYHSDAEATGLIVRAEGKTIYISGDTEYRDELSCIIRKSAGSEIDIAIICINGRLGNMNFEDAVKTGRSLGVRTAIPMHYGLFEQNTADPVPFVEACKGAGMNSFMMQPGKSIKLN